MDYDDFNEEEMFSPHAIHPQPRAVPPRPAPHHPDATSRQRYVDHSYAPAPLDTRPALAVPLNTNPLEAYFRSPGLHVVLPTKGAFLPVEDFSPSIVKDVPVYPMRSADELILKNPDALMSGHAIECLLRSCVPAIKNPRTISTPDLDVLLLGIRAATFGDSMDLEVDCPSCENHQEFTVSLAGVMATAKSVPTENPVRITDDLIIYMRPYDLQTATKVAVSQFEETRKIQGAQELSPEERKDIVTDAFNKLTIVQRDSLTSCVVKVAIPGGEVTDFSHISEFMEKTDRNTYAKLEDKVKELNGMGINKTIRTKCSKCEHEWDAPVEFDPASFFDSGS